MSEEIVNQPPRDEILIVDFSSILHPTFHMSGSEPDPNYCSTKVVARIRGLASGRRYVLVACDSGKSFRHDVDASYKSSRPDRDAVLIHQGTLAREVLVNDGFPVIGVKGFEADDVICAATKRAIDAGMDVLVASADKDLLALVGPHVRQLNTQTGVTIDEAGVVEKFGVKPSQFTDYLSLVGDKSDDVVGAKGIGPKKASALLAKFGTLDALYAKLDEHGLISLGLTAGDAASLLEFRDRLPTVRALITMRTDVDLPFDEILKERVPKDAEMTMTEDETMTMPEPDPTDTETLDMFREASAPGPAAPAQEAPATATTTETVAEAQPDGTVRQVKVQTQAAAPPAAPASKPSLIDDVIAATPTDWKLQLDPRSMDQARKLATDLFQSRMFSAYGTPQAILSTILMGRSLGLDAMASLRGIFNVEGRHCLSAQLMVAIILKSGMAEYFRPVEISETSATYETLRKGPGQKPFQLTHTLEMARVAGVVKPKSNWEKSPVDMLCARASSRLARLIFADLLFGLYTTDEVEEFGRG